MVFINFSTIRYRITAKLPQKMCKIRYRPSSHRCDAVAMVRMVLFRNLRSVNLGSLFGRPSFTRSIGIVFITHRATRQLPNGKRRASYGRPNDASLECKWQREYLVVNLKKWLPCEVVNRRFRNGGCLMEIFYLIFQVILAITIMGKAIPWNRIVFVWLIIYCWIMVCTGKWKSM